MTKKTSNNPSKKKQEPVPEPVLSERTERRIQMFIERGYFKQKTDVIAAALELLVRRQMEIDSVGASQPETSEPKDNTEKKQ